MEMDGRMAKMYSGIARRKGEDEMEYAMYTKAGDTAVTRMVRRLVRVPRYLSDKEFGAIYAGEMRRVAKRYAEVNDTCARELIAIDLAALTGRNLWGVSPTGIEEAKQRWSGKKPRTMPVFKGAKER
jgi:hypothetical protein